MAVDRTWWNALVDDDGSDELGTKWNKARIAELLNSVDAEIARLDARHTSGTFAPTLLGSGGGTPLYSGFTGRWVKSGRQMAVAGQLSLTSKGTLAGSLSIGGLPVGGTAGIQQAGPPIGYFAGLAAAGASLSTYINPGGTAANLVWVPAAGMVTIQALDTSAISNGFAVIFGGVYLID